MRVPLVVLRGTQPRRVRVAAHRLNRGEHDLRVRRQRPYRHLRSARCISDLLGAAQEPRAAAELTCWAFQASAPPWGGGWRKRLGSNEPISKADSNMRPESDRRELRLRA